jgi:hypothetical protein
MQHRIHSKEGKFYETLPNRSCLMNTFGKLNNVFLCSAAGDSQCESKGSEKCCDKKYPLSSVFKKHNFFLYCPNLLFFGPSGYIKCHAKCFQ